MLVFYARIQHTTQHNTQNPLLSYCDNKVNNDDNDKGDGCSEYKVDWAAFVYFGVAVVTLASCIFAYRILESMEITAYYRRVNGIKKKDEVIGRGESASRAEIHVDDSAMIFLTHVVCITTKNNNAHHDKTHIYRPLL